MKTLKELRIEHNYSEQQIAAIVGITKGTYKKYEKQLPNISLITAARLCDALDLSLGDLISLV